MEYNLERFIQSLFQKKKFSQNSLLEVTSIYKTFLSSGLPITKLKLFR